MATMFKHLKIKTFPKWIVIKYSFRFNESICLEKWEGPNKGTVKSSWRKSKIKVFTVQVLLPLTTSAWPCWRRSNVWRWRAGLPSCTGYVQCPCQTPSYHFPVSDKWRPRKCLQLVNSSADTWFVWPFYFRVFFIPLIVIGSFFMLNLVLGVLSG